ncbi:unnamed protein product, partial [Amoebophrya sp. A25]|eukprot:GSA25T00006084001.1
MKNTANISTGRYARAVFKQPSRVAEPEVPLNQSAAVFLGGTNKTDSAAVAASGSTINNTRIQISSQPNTTNSTTKADAFTWWLGLLSDLNEDTEGETLNATAANASNLMSTGDANTTETGDEDDDEQLRTLNNSNATIPGDALGVAPADLVDEDMRGQFILLSLTLFARTHALSGSTAALLPVTERPNMTLIPITEFVDGDVLHFRCPNEDDELWGTLNADADDPQRVITTRCQSAKDPDSNKPRPISFLRFPIREVLVYRDVATGGMSAPVSLLYEYRAPGGSAVHYVAARKNYYRDPASATATPGADDLGLFVFDTAINSSWQPRVGLDGLVYKVRFQQPTSYPASNNLDG